MRLAFLALALAACARSSGPASPSNQAAAPDYRATADDVLGFLPSDAEIVFGVDMVQLRGSALWPKFAPAILGGVNTELDMFRSQCGFDPVQTVARVTLAMSGLGGDAPRGVVVVRGVDGARVMECVAKHATKNGGTASTDRGVLVVQNGRRPDHMGAMTVVANNTVVIQLDTKVGHDSLRAILASGTPLRASPAFMALHQRSERGASMWGMANGNAKIFDLVASMGFRPKSVDGTVTMTDRMTATVRLTFNTADEANKLAAELNKISGAARSMVERLDIRPSGAMLTIDAVVTDPQLRTLMGMMGIPVL